jgi:hypothetical protein
MEINEHPLWDTMNNLNFIKEYLEENLIEDLPNSFWELLDKSITDVETVVKTESKFNISEAKCSCEPVKTKDENGNISDVITRFGLPDETEEKVLRFLHLKGMIKTKTYLFSTFDDIYNEMCELRDWLGRL